MQESELESFLAEAGGQLVEDAPRQTILRKDQPTEEISFLVEGWAMRFVVLPDGRRQILSFLLRGDTACMRLLHTEKLPYSVQAISPTRRWVFPLEHLRKTINSNPGYAEEFFRLYHRWLALMDSIVTDLGRRKAPERMARFLLRVIVRVSAAQGHWSDSVQIPLSQSHMADALGLTPVHINRTLMSFRDMGALSFERGSLEMLDIDQVLAIADMPNSEFRALKKMFEI